MKLTLMGRKKNDWPIIKKRVYPSGSVAWVVDCGMVDRKRPRFTYDTKGEAETKAQQLRIERENDGNAIFIVSAHDQTDAARALSILAPFNVSLSAAAEFYKTHAGLIQTKKTADQVAAELLEAKAQDHLSARHRKNLRLQLKEGFAADERFASRPICEITTRELEAWLRELDVSPTTRNNYRAALGVLFSFALRRGYVLKNPVTLAERAKVKAEKPAILTVAEARALIESAETDFIPAVALGLFAGLRPESEVWPLDWRQIDFKDKTIDVSQSKNLAGERFVKMSENLIEWLRPHAQKSGPVSASGDAYYCRLQISRDKAASVLRNREESCPNLENWGQDSLRHSYASYYYALNKNAHETAEQMGHVGGLRIFFRHYRNRVREEAAREFWAIRPAPSSRVVNSV
jgi:integrase